MVEEEVDMGRYLVIAHQTAAGPALRREIQSTEAANRGSEFVLLVPATPIEHLNGWTEGEAVRAAEDAGERSRQAFAADGIQLADVRVGDANPLYAIKDAFIGDDFDAVIISTLSKRLSRWMRSNLVRKAEKSLTVPVIHVEDTD